MLARLDPTYADKPLNTAHEFARALYLWKAAISEFRNDALKFTGSVIADAFFPTESTKVKSHHTSVRSLRRRMALIPGTRARPLRRRPCGSQFGTDVEQVGRTRER